MDFAAYQSAAKETSKLELAGPKSAIAPMLGLASETGAILNVYKRYLRDSIDLAANRDFLREELGDLLWYLTAIATACELDMEEIAESNLRRVHDRYPSKPWKERIASLPFLEQGYPEHEHFPRKLIVKFSQDKSAAGQMTCRMILVHAEPNTFPDGPRTVDGKEVGFFVGSELGAHLTDNSRRMDAYRFHDAIHMGFMTVLGWSPTMRALLRIKRKSNLETDANEDGARAIFAEEGLAAVLSRLAERRLGFLTEDSVDGDALVVAKAAAVDLEVEKLPGWLWVTAISQGFQAKRALEVNSGGYLIADLTERRLTHEKTL